jgi:TolB-like protein
VQLPNVEISWSAFKIADALGALRRLIVVPRYILDGSVSKQENQVRIGVEMIRHGELVQAWSFDSSQDFGDCAYQVSYAVLREYA